MLLSWVASTVVVNGFGFATTIGVDPAPTADQQISAPVTIAVLALIGAVLYQACWRSGLTLERDHLAVHRLRRRTIAWADITAVSVERIRGSHRVVVQETDGRRTVLPAPRIGLLLWDRRFGAKAQRIHASWLDSQDPDRISVDETDPGCGMVVTVPDRPRVWQRAIVTIACAGLGYLLFMTLLVASLFAFLS
jgi:hypothetical protein